MTSRSTLRTEDTCALNQRHKSPQISPPEASATTFFQNSSMRGVPKLVKYRQASLRNIWVVFVFSMAFILIYGVVTLVIEYLNYNTLINTRESHEGNAARFPSITICNHHRFKPTAEEEWLGRGVLSPRGFSETVRRTMRQLFERNANWRDTRDVFLSDQITTYYETIGTENASRIGHENGVLYCILQLKSAGIRVGHGGECGIQMSRFQHPTFFNCYTVSVAPEISQDAITLGLIVHVGREPNRTGERFGLMQEIFNQAHGNKVVLHEPDTYPDPVKQGVNLETGKFTQMRFNTIKSIGVPSPVEGCVLPGNLGKRWPHNFQINNLSYEYTLSLCKLNAIAKQIRSECTCYSSLYPLTDQEKINKSVPYCQAFNATDVMGTLERRRCLQQNIYLGESMCQRRCEYYRYDIHVSTSHWISQEWQVYWLMLLSDAWMDLEKGDHNSSGFNKSMSDIRAFLYAESPEELVRQVNIQMDVNDNAFFVVSRASFATMEHVETLSLTFNALMCRIGGISSLTLGVTFATLFEVGEFLFLCYFRRNAQKTTSNNDSAPI